MALTRCRKVLELVVRVVYQGQYGESPGTRPLENLLQRLSKDGHLPAQLEPYTNAVRLLGNVGTHNLDERLTAADVHQSLSGLIQVLHWLVREGRPASPAVNTAVGWSVQTLLPRLAGLPEPFRGIRDGVENVLRLADLDPEMGLTRIRKVLEYVVRDVFERRVGEPPGTRPLENLIQRLVKDGYFPDRLDAYATTIRKLGNVGTHTFGEKITAADVHQSLANLMPILEWYLQEERPEALAGQSGVPPTIAPDQPPTDPPSDQPSPDQPLPRVAVVPKGLRSFDANDSKFFLELLPGPRDEKGLPESIRFWKHRIEAADELTFTVGVIYGPSGCGKVVTDEGRTAATSSAARIVTVYVEATAADTEARLLKGLRKRCSDLPGNLDLTATIAALRNGEGLCEGQKVFVVLDQFEQWLHAARGRENAELVQALRQCDGERVQAVVLVRDDFWMALTRFMQELQLEMLPGQNTTVVDLFDLRHARKVLAAFGTAFGTMTESTTTDQEAFLEQTVHGLAQDGRVISVRLALFAEMVKGKEWTPATLKEVGGTEGVGVTFLEETFSSRTASAPPKHRYHQKAARAVLKVLLPESGTDIKGHMRSHAELLAASGYARRSQDFEELLRILDAEVRFITPAEPPDAESGAARKYYQLTHDYLVHSLRDWLTRKQKETRRGRAELLLADRAVVWNARRENRQLPSLWEWLNIRLLTSADGWTPLQRQMMRTALWYHALRSGVWLLLAAGLAVAAVLQSPEKAVMVGGAALALLLTGALGLVLAARLTQSLQQRQTRGPPEDRPAAEDTERRLGTGAETPPPDVSAAFRVIVENQFPSPIARPFADLRKFDGWQAEIPQLANVLGATLQHLAQLALAEYLAGNDRDAKLDQLLLAEFKKPLSHGAWAGVLRGVLTFLHERGHRTLMPELLELYFPPQGQRKVDMDTLKGLGDELVSQRNDLIKRSIDAVPDREKHRQFKRLLVDFLRAVAFLKYYPFVSVKGMHTEEGVRCHRCRLHVGHDDALLEFTVQSDLDLETQRVLVLNPRGREVLSLYPFYIVDQCPQDGCGAVHLFRFERLEKTRVECFSTGGHRLNSAAAGAQLQLLLKAVAAEVLCATRRSTWRWPGTE